MSSPSTIVLITGANSGIGYAAAQVIASASPSYHVIMASRSVEKGKAALSEIQAAGVKGALSMLQLDVTDEQSINAATKQVEKEFGRLDVLVNNAGILSRDESLKKQFEDTFRANVVGPVLMTNAFEPLLLKSARPYLLHISSGLGSSGMASDPNSRIYNISYPSYCASKSALNMIMVDDYKRLGKEGVKAFSVCPGLVRSNLRGTEEEHVSAGGAAISATTSGEFILNIMEGKRDADAGKFVHKDGIYPW